MGSILTRSFINNFRSIGLFYGKKLQIDIHYHMRNEEKFPSVEALKNQLAIDKTAALQYIHDKQL